jgi:hypothetical protein
MIIEFVLRRKEVKDVEEAEEVQERKNPPGTNGRVRSSPSLP